VKRVIESEPECEIIYGDIDYEMKQPGFENGFFQSPIVLEGINIESDAYLENFIGPVFSLYRVNSL